MRFQGPSPTRYLYECGTICRSYKSPINPRNRAIPAAECLLGVNGQKNGVERRQIIRCRCWSSCRKPLGMRWSTVHFAKRSTEEYEVRQVPWADGWRGIRGPSSPVPAPWRPAGTWPGSSGHSPPAPAPASHAPSLVHPEIFGGIQLDILNHGVCVCNPTFLTAQNASVRVRYMTI